MSLPRLLSVLVLGVLLSMSLSAQAQVPLCWQLTPFDDVLFIAPVQVLPSGPTMFHLNGQWNGLDIYYLEGAGTAATILGGDIEFGMAFAHRTPFFDGNGSV